MREKDLTVIDEVTAEVEEGEVITEAAEGGAEEVEGVLELDSEVVLTEMEATPEEEDIETIKTTEEMTGGQEMIAITGETTEMVMMIEGETTTTEDLEEKTVTLLGMTTKAMVEATEDHTMMIEDLTTEIGGMIGDHTMTIEDLTTGIEEITEGTITDLTMMTGDLTTEGVEVKGETTETIEETIMTTKDQITGTDQLMMEIEQRQ